MSSLVTAKNIVGHHSNDVVDAHRLVYISCFESFKLLSDLLRYIIIYIIYILLPILAEKSELGCQAWRKDLEEEKFRVLTLAVRNSFYESLVVFRNAALLIYMAVGIVIVKLSLTIHTERF